MTVDEPAHRPFGDWLRQRRRALDLTRQELARQIGCSAVTLRKLESEERRPSKQMVDRLAEVLDIPAGERQDFQRFARGDPFAHGGSPFGAPAPGPYTHPASTPSRQHNLPLQLTKFIGREQDLAQLRQRLGNARLLTLTGVGGTGKTRLALEAAASLLNEYADGAWLVELASLTDPAQVPQAVGAALGLREAPGRPINALLLEHLGARHLLLVLDSCEHLVPACAELAGTLLRGCPRVTVLATSREPLEIPGEINLVVQPLSAPEANRSLPMEAVAQYEAVQLFADRAALVLPGFQLAPANAAGVAHICAELDGLPLAIELAAARVKLLTVDQIAGRLSDRFQLLSGGRRTETRHQTLAGMLDWSYELLSEPERALLRRLAVFRGGWTLEAAESICGDSSEEEGGRIAPRDEGPNGVAIHPVSFVVRPSSPVLRSSDVLDLLTGLANKSMIVVQRWPDEAPRYRLLETIRHYAWARLAAAGELAMVQRRHASYFLALAEANRAQKAQAFFDWSEQLDREHDNLQAALSWAQASPEGSGLLLGLTGELWSYWQHHGYWSEARAWQTAALAVPGLEGPEHDPARARVLAGLGIMVELQGEYAAGMAHLARSLDLFRALGDEWWQANALHWLGWGQRERGQVEAAQQALSESLRLFRKLDDRVWAGRVLNTLGSLEIIRENPARATPLLQEGLALNEAVGDRGNAAWSLNYLGHAAQLEGDLGRAERRHAQALEMFTELALDFGIAWAQHGLGETALAAGEAGHARAHLAAALELFNRLGDRAGVAWCLEGLAGVAGLGGDYAQAARLWGGAESLRRSIGARPAPAGRATRERLMAAAREQLGAAAFEAAWAEGQAMTPEQAFKLALSTG